MRSFEIVVIDPSGQSEILTEQSLVFGLLSSDKMWNEAKDQAIESGGHMISDSGLNIQVNKLSVLNDLVESAFVIKVSSDNFDRLEEFRIPFLSRLKNRLSFSYIRILNDDISSEIAIKIYPIINKLENSLRRYIIKFFTQKVGVNWWEQGIPEEVSQKIKMRGGNEKNFVKYVKSDILLVDFDDIGEIIYKHKFGLNKQENLIKRISSLGSQNSLADHKSQLDEKEVNENEDKIELNFIKKELNRLKEDLNSNYTKFFKANFKDKDFQSKWTKLVSLRNKVAHNNLFIKADLDLAKKLNDEVLQIIVAAEENINEFSFSIEEQIQLLDNPLISEEDVTEIEITEHEDDNEDEKVLEAESKSKAVVITELDLMRNLVRAEKLVESNPFMSFVGLKWFAYKNPMNNKFDSSRILSIINILDQKGMIEIYEVDNPNSKFNTKAIRTNHPQNIVRTPTS